MTDTYTPAQDERFKPIVAKIIQNEGAALNDNHQTGECSKFGISLKFLQGIRPAATRDDIINMAQEGAERLYREFFWKNTNIWRIEGDALAFKVCDLAVNMGPGTAIKLLQSAIGLRADAVIGPMTAAAANANDQELILARLKDKAEARYRQIAENPVQAQFLEGWLTRLEKA